jgi:hypothetical protein
MQRTYALCISILAAWSATGGVCRAELILDQAKVASLEFTIDQNIANYTGSGMWKITFGTATDLPISPSEPLQVSVNAPFGQFPISDPIGEITLTAPPHDDDVLFEESLTEDPGTWPTIYSGYFTFVGETGSDLITHAICTCEFASVNFDSWTVVFAEGVGSGAALPSADPLSTDAPEPTTAMLIALAMLIFPSNTFWRTRRGTRR